MTDSHRHTKASCEAALLTASCLWWASALSQARESAAPAPHHLPGGYRTTQHHAQQPAICGRT